MDRLHLDRCVGGLDSHQLLEQEDDTETVEGLAPWANRAGRAGRCSPLGQDLEGTAAHTAERRDGLGRARADAGGSGTGALGEIRAGPQLERNGYCETQP